MELIRLIKMIVHSTCDVYGVYEQLCLDDIWDYTIEIRNLIKKVRKLYGLQFNLSFSDLKELKGTREKIDDVLTIELNGEPFSFLIHAVSSLNPEFGAYPNIIKNDLSTLFKLYGSNTLSMSSFSNKHYSFLNDEDENGIFLLFNKVCDTGILAMYYDDAMVTHYPLTIAPFSDYNLFLDYDSLAITSYYNASYDEVATLREGMVPCALLTVGKEVKPQIVKCAKQLANHLGQEIPIIKFNIEKYRNNKVVLDNLSRNIKDKVTCENIEELFYTLPLNGVGRDELNLVLRRKIVFLLSELIKQFNEERIDIKELLKNLSFLQITIQRFKGSALYESGFYSFVRSFKEIIACLYQQFNDFKIISEVDYCNIYNIRIENDSKRYSVYPMHSFFDGIANFDELYPEQAIQFLEKIVVPNNILDNFIVNNKKTILRITKLDRNINDAQNLIENTLMRNYDSSICNQLFKHFIIDFILADLAVDPDVFMVDERGNILVPIRYNTFEFLDTERTCSPDFIININPLDTSGRVREIYGSVYNKLLINCANGNIKLDYDELLDIITKLELISDEEYKLLFKNYIKSFYDTDVERTLNLLTVRKKNCCESLKQFIYTLKDEKSNKLSLEKK